MRKPIPFWFLLDLYAWVVLAMSIVTAVIIGQWWVVLVGIIGYLLVLLIDLAGGRALGPSGAARFSQLDQENRELKAEQARLLGGLKERDERLAALGKQPAPPPAPDATLTEDSP